MPHFMPLIVTGTARSGSTLLCRLLSAHPEVMLASDPFFPLFYSLRDAILREAVTRENNLLSYIGLPLQDYYFSDYRIGVLDAIQSVNPATSFDRGEWQRLRESIVVRAQDESADLIPSLGQMVGDTYQDIFEKAIKIIAEARGAGSRRWIGFKDVWVIEFFYILARIFSNARFVVLLRDPRAMIASMLKMAENDPSQRGHLLSYARHWRKQMAFLHHYQSDPSFANRLHALTYEHLVTQPEAAARDLCSFLEISYHPDMLDPEKYIDYASGAAWKGNSSFEASLRGVSTAVTDRWRETLENDVLKLIELVCGPEMAWAGYQLVSDPAALRRPDPSILCRLIEDDQQEHSWRSDLGDPLLDYGAELSRLALLDLDPAPNDTALIRRAFLFEDVYFRLREILADDS